MNDIIEIKQADMLQAINRAEATLTLDVIKDNIVKNLSQKKQLLIMRILIVVFIAISAIIAIVQHKSNVTFIAQLMGISWGALAGAFLAPFLYGLYWKKTTNASVWVSFIFGAGIMVLNLFFKGMFTDFLKSPINCGVFAMLSGLILVPVVSWFTKKPDKEKVEQMFDCYNKKILVSAKESLGDE